MNLKTSGILLVLIGGCGIVLLFDDLRVRSRASDLGLQVTKNQDIIRALTQAKASADLGSVTEAEAKAAEPTHAQPTAMELALADQLDKIRRLEQRVRDDPKQNTPELKLLTPSDWAKIAQETLSLDSDSDFARAFGALRQQAILSHVAPAIQTALKQFEDANNAQLPSDITQLAPYLDAAIDSSILARFQVISAGAAQRGSDPYVIELNPSTAVDQAWDSAILFGANTLTAEGGGDGMSVSLRSSVALAEQAYETANPSSGRTPLEQQEREKLVPYFLVPNEGAKYLAYLQTLEAH